MNTSIRTHPVDTDPQYTAPEDLRKSLRSGDNQVTSPSSFPAYWVPHALPPLTPPFHWPVRSSIPLNPRSCKEGPSDGTTTDRHGMVQTPTLQPSQWKWSSDISGVSQGFRVPESSHVQDSYLCLWAFRLSCHNFARLWIGWTASVVWWSEFLATDLDILVWFLVLPGFLRSSGSGTGSTQPVNTTEELL
jgi:hypothetical protein